MSANLVEFFTDQMGPQLVGPVEQLLAVSEDEARKALHVAIPAVLAGFAQLATTQQGAAILSVASNTPALRTSSPTRPGGRISWRRTALRLGTQRGRLSG
jgi:Bacterial protein of unknown function (DUF937)